MYVTLKYPNITIRHHQGPRDSHKTPVQDCEVFREDCKIVTLLKQVQSVTREVILDHVIYKTFQNTNKLYEKFRGIFEITNFKD